METLKKVGRIFLNIVFVLIILITIIFMCGFIQMKKSNNKYVNIFGYTVMQVVTGSMSGTIEEQDIIVVKITKDVKTNDIITYDNGKNLITHRIIKINDDFITTKGDANNTEDKPITNDLVVGKVVFIAKNVAIWVKVFTTPAVIISLIVTISLIYVVCFYKK